MERRMTQEECFELVASLDMLSVNRLKHSVLMQAPLTAEDVLGHMNRIEFQRLMMHLFVEGVLHKTQLKENNQ